jgi:hypothetical protein
MARFEFTMVSDAILQGLADGGATGSETRAYIMLIRGLPKDRSNAECWMPADMAEAKGVMSAAMFTKAVTSLSKKEFAIVDGEPRTVLTKVTRGCRGHCPHYEDTLGRLIAEGKYPQTNATPNSDAKSVSNGTPKQTPIGEFSTLDWNTKTDQLEHQNGPIGTPTGAPIETIQDRHIPVAAAAPPAQRSGGVSQPHKHESTSNALQVVSDHDPARAEAGAGEGRPAPALTFDELMGRAPRTEAAQPTAADEARYQELLRKVEGHMATGGDYDEALTPQERAEFQRISEMRRASARAE